MSSPTSRSRTPTSNATNEPFPTWPPKIGSPRSRRCKAGGSRVNVFVGIYESGGKIGCSRGGAGRWTAGTFFRHRADACWERIVRSPDARTTICGPFTARTGGRLRPAGGTTGTRIRTGISHDSSPWPRTASAFTRDRRSVSMNEIAIDCRGQRSCLGFCHNRRPTTAA